MQEEGEGGPDVSVAHCVVRLPKIKSINYSSPDIQLALLFGWPGTLGGDRKLHSRLRGNVAVFVSLLYHF